MKQVSLRTIAIICNAYNQRMRKEVFSDRYINLYDYEHIIIMENGELFNLKTNKFLTQNKDKFGYLSVTIDGVKFYVHRLVALGFVSWDKKGVIVCHKNKVRVDNRAINIMWSNNNFINIRRNGFDSPNKGRKVNAYDLDGNFIDTFNNGGHASRQLGLNRSEVYRCCKGERKSTGGYTFKYKPELEIGE